MLKNWGVKELDRFLKIPVLAKNPHFCVSCRLTKSGSPKEGLRGYGFNKDSKQFLSLVNLGPAVRVILELRICPDPKPKS